jgi:hypothetical protein
MVRAVQDVVLHEIECCDVARGIEKSCTQLENAIQTFNTTILYASRGINTRVVLQQNNARLIAIADGDGVLDDESYGDEFSDLEERIDVM